METFKHINASSVEEAVSALGQNGGNTAIIAGGTDLLGSLKDRILAEYPESLVNIKTIPGLDYINEEGGTLKIGALTRLIDIAADTTVKTKYAALAEAAGRVGSPHLRSMGTLGGNLCQDTRCWFYRARDNHYYCFRKGGTLCFAQVGSNKFNAILGGQVCFAVCPSDTAIALTALNATIVTSKRTIPIDGFYKVLENVLDDDEIVTEVQVPEPSSGTKQFFLKVSLRKAIDFAIESVALCSAV
jgi:xanthine dehydrogenase YagS FAD-binding subunit